MSFFDVKPNSAYPRINYAHNKGNSREDHNNIPLYSNSSCWGATTPQTLITAPKLETDNHGQPRGVGQGCLPRVAR